MQMYEVYDTDQSSWNEMIPTLGSHAIVAHRNLGSHLKGDVYITDPCYPCVVLNLAPAQIILQLR